MDTPMFPAQQAAAPAQPGMDQESAPEGAAAPGYTIEIAVSGDGSITVSVESEGQEAAEGQEPGSEDVGAQPAENIKEALTLALAAFKNNGKLPNVQGQADAFDQGFASGPGGQPQPAQPTDMGAE